VLCAGAPEQLKATAPLKESMDITVKESVVTPPRVFTAIPAPALFDTMKSGDATSAGLVELM
jgi:hypothetical protein